MDHSAIDTLGQVPHGGDLDPRVLDFSANTNPNTPPGTHAAYMDAFAAAKRYPDPAYRSYRTAAAEYLTWEHTQADVHATLLTPASIIPTAGGLVGMRLLFECTLSQGDSVLVPTPSFGEYAREVRLQGATPVFVSHDSILSCDPTAHDVAIVCNPNNPTGTLYDRSALTSFATRCVDAETTLLVDEAFLDYTNAGSLVGMDGVVVARSLTKIFGLPGLRAGFLATTDSLGDRLSTAKPTWGLSTPASRVGEHCFSQTAFVKETIERVATERTRMTDRLSERFTVYPSAAPFLLLETDRPVADIVEETREHGVAIRDATTFRGLDSHIRVAIKQPAQNDRLLEALNV